jgi:hypothetical protein
LFHHAGLEEPAPYLIRGHPVFSIPILKEPSIVVLIFSESEELHSAVHEINVLAFGQDSETILVENLRKSCSFNTQLSFVAASLPALTLAPCR